MPISLPVYVQYISTADGTSKDGLTVTVDVHEVNKTTLAQTETAGIACTGLGDGFYGYVIPNANPAVYDYLCNFKTADTTVTQKHSGAFRWDAAETWAIQLAMLDALITSRLAAASYTAPPTVAAIADAVLDEASAGHTGLIPTNLDAQVSTRLASASYSAPPTAAVIADAVLDEAATGHTGLIPTNLDAKVSSIYAKVAGGRITVLAPVLANGDVVTVQGGDYYDVDGLALEWSITHPTDFAGATAKAVIDGVMEIPVTIVEPSADPKVFRAEVSSAVTALIAAGLHPFRLVVTFETPGEGEADPTYRYVYPLEGKWQSDRIYTA